MIHCRLCLGPFREQIYQLAHLRVETGNLGPSLQLPWAAPCIRTPIHRHRHVCNDIVARGGSRGTTCTLQHKQREEYGVKRFLFSSGVQGERPVDGRAGAPNVCWRDRQRTWVTFYAVMVRLDQLQRTFTLRSCDDGT
jgi:hypothetical protein